MKQFLDKYYFLLLILLLPNLIFAEVSYECTIVQEIVGDNLEVSFYIKSTGDSFELGGANLRINLNTDALDASQAPAEIAEGLWDDDYDPDNYFDQIPGYDNPNNEWVSINTFPQLTFSGVTVPSVETLMGKISIPILNLNATSDVTWRTSEINNNVVLCDVNLNDITSNGNFINPSSILWLPIELNSFNANLTENGVELNWKTSVELNSKGFDVQRTPKGAEENWETLGFIEGSGNSLSIKEYSYVDKNLYGGRIFLYRLKQMDNDGRFEFSESIEVDVTELLTYELSQNYPNPFNPNTKIKFSLKQQGDVYLAVYNIIGEKITELVNREMEAGYHLVDYNGSSLASGIYIYKLDVKNQFSAVKKMILIK